MAVVATPPAACSSWSRLMVTRTVTGSPRWVPRVPVSSSTRAIASNASWFRCASVRVSRAAAAANTAGAMPSPGPVGDSGSVGVVHPGARVFGQHGVEHRAGGRGQVPAEGAHSGGVLASQGEPAAAGAVALVGQGAVGVEVGQDPVPDAVDVFGGGGGRDPGQGGFGQCPLLRGDGVGDLADHVADGAGVVGADLAVALRGGGVGQGDRQVLPGEGVPGAQVAGGGDPGPGVGVGDPQQLDQQLLDGLVAAGGGDTAFLDGDEELVHGVAESAGGGFDPAQRGQDLGVAEQMQIHIAHGGDRAGQGRHRGCRLGGRGR